MVWRSGNAFRLVIEVTLWRTRLVLQWVSACGQVNRLGTKPAS